MSDAVMVPREAIEALAREYRPSMDKDTVHDWGADAASMLKRLAASPPVGGWEDINALPEAMKDGVTRFLVAYTDGVVRACRWLDNSKTDWPWKGVSPTEQIPMRADARMTHWMHLPSPVSTGSRPQEAVPGEQADGPVVGLQHGPLAGQDVSLLTPNSMMLVRSYGDSLRLARFISASPSRRPSDEGDAILRVEEDGQTAPNCWGVHRFSYIGERDADGWIVAPEGGWATNPAGEARVQLRYDFGSESDDLGVMAHTVVDGWWPRSAAFRLTPPLAEGLARRQAADGCSSNEGAGQ